MAKKTKAQEPRQDLYQITLDREMLGRLSNAMELLSRFQFGQFQYLLESIKDAKKRHISTELARSATSYLDRVLKPVMGLSHPHSSWGVGHDEEIDAFWDMYTACRYRLAWDRAVETGVIAEGEARKWPEMMQVNYDEPTHFSRHFIEVVKRIKP